MADTLNFRDFPEVTMAEEYRKLFRSRKNRMLFGVCGGLGEYLNTDPTVIRVLAVILCVLSAGMGIIGYFVMVFIVPEADPDKLP